MISIIVPIYQAKSYLEKCVDSILSQTYKEIELLLIDDGSTDGSSEICDDYAKNNVNVKAIHQQNAGVSFARNKGVSNASGDWVMFIDADDYVSSTLCEDLIKHADEKTDVIISGFVEDFGNKQQTIKVADTVCCSHNDLKQNFDSYHRLLLLNSPFAKLYKRDLLQNIKFNTNISMGEDFLFNLECFEHARNIKFIPSADYYYNLTNADSATKKYKEEYFNCYIKCYEEGKKFKYGEVKFTNDSLDESFCSNCLYFIQSIIYNVRSGNEKRLRIKDVLDNSYFRIVCSGKYDYSLIMKIMQTLVKTKKYALLELFFSLKKALSVLKR